MSDEPWTDALGAFAKELYGFIESIDLSTYKQQPVGVHRERLLRIDAAARALLKEHDKELPKTTKLALGTLGKMIGKLKPFKNRAKVEAALTPIYSTLRFELQKAGWTKLERVRPTNYSRSIGHMNNAFWIVIGRHHIFNSAIGAVYVAATAAILSWACELLRRISPAFNAAITRLLGRFIREHELKEINSATWFMTGLVIITVFFPGKACVLSVIALGVGDPAAGIIGRAFGTRFLYSRRFWGGKSVEGLVAFVVVTFWTSLLYLYIYHSEATAKLPPQYILLYHAAVAAVASVVGAVTELLSVVVDDNLAITVITAAAVWYGEQLAGLVPVESLALAPIIDNGIGLNH